MALRSGGRLVRRSLAAALILPFVALPEGSASAQDPDSPAGSSFQVCPELTPGAELDIVVLMDVSLSLVRGPGGAAGSDPRGLRFDAVDRLVDGLAIAEGDEEPPRNIAVVTFGGTTQQVVFDGGDPDPSAWRRLDEASSVSIRRSTREQSDPGRLPIDQTRYTDYVVAASEAARLLVTRPAENCRVLVWFTDGVHDPNDDASAGADAPEADALLDAFCGPDGLVADLRALKVSPFILFLEPTVRPEFERRLGASLAVMKALTGDPDPQLGRAAAAATPPCSAPSGKVGEILPASDAERLIGLLGDLVNVIAGGQPAVPEDCPYVGGPVDSYPLPDAHLVEWLSLASYDTQRSVSVNEVRVLDASDQVITGALRVLPGSDDGNQQFGIEPRAVGELGPGWRIEIPDSGDLCLRLKLADIALEVSGRPSVRALEPPDLPTELFEGRLSLRARDGSDLPLEAGVAIPPGVQGLLEVEFAEPFVENGLLVVRIVVVGAPTIDCLGLQVPDAETLGSSLGRITVPEGRLRSSICTIGLDGIEAPVTVDAGRAVEGLASACPAGSEWTLITVGPSGESAVGDRIELAPGSDVTGIGVVTDGDVPNARIDCSAVAIPPITIDWQGASTPVPLDFGLVLESRPNVVATLLLTLVATVVAAVLSLVLLRALNALWVRPPAASDLRAYEFDAELVLGAGDTPRLVFDGGAFRFDQDRWRSVAADGPGGLAAGSLRLARRLPSILRPWQEPVLEARTLPASALVVARPSLTRADEMPCGFRDCVVLSASTTRRPTADRSARVRLTVIVPRTGSGSGRESVERLVLEEHADLVRRLADRLDAEVEAIASTAASSRPGGPPTGPSGRADPGGGTRPPSGPSSGPPSGPPSGPQVGPSSGSPRRTAGPAGGDPSDDDGDARRARGPRPPSPPKPPTPPT